MDGARDLLELTAAIAADYVESLGERPVFPDVTPEELREALGGPLPEEPLSAREVVEQLAESAGRGLVATGSGRYFGFVIGGVLPAALAADWLASTWDQNAGLYVAGPSASVAEQVTREWLVELLGLPAGASIGFVTGTQMAWLLRASTSYTRSAGTSAATGSRALPRYGSSSGRSGT